MDRYEVMTGKMTPLTDGAHRMGIHRKGRDKEL